MYYLKQNRECLPGEDYTLVEEVNKTLP